ncbi:MAG: MFS transporter [Chloroflexota bacterium]
MRRQSIFYGWFIVAITVVGAALVYGVRHSFSVFFPPILNEFGWSRGSTTIMLSLNLVAYGFFAPVAGGMADHWKPRWTMLTGVTVLALSAAGCALATQLWHFYLLFGILMPAGTALCGMPLLTPALSNWFIKRRGLVMGLGLTGTGFSFAYGFFVEFVISQVGWRSAFSVLAGILFVILAPLYLFFFRYRPEEKGLKAYGSDEVLPLAVEKTTGSATPEGFTLGQALRTSQLWLLALSWALYWGIACYLVLAHQVKFAEDVGYSGTFAASVFGLFGIGMIAGQLSSSISDWIGREKAVTLAALLSIGGLAALMLVGDTSRPWLLYIYAVCFGYGAGLYPSTIVAAAADIFHGRHFGAIAGLLLTGVGIGGAFGPTLGGYIYDIYGSYTYAFILCLACFVLACISFWIAAPRHATRLRAKALGI